MAEHDAAIRAFEHATCTTSSECTQHMGCLVQQSIAPLEFTAYCAAYADGVRYIYNRFSVAPDDMMFANTPSPPPDGCLIVARSDIAWAITEGLVKTPLSDPFILNQDQAAFVKGVADAHRLCLAIRRLEESHEPSRYDVAEVSQVTALPKHQPTHSAYTEDTAYVVRMAMMERGMNKAISVAQARRKPRATSSIKSWENTMKSKQHTPREQDQTRPRNDR